MLYVLQTALMAFIMYNLLLGLVFVLVTHIERREVEAKVYGIQIMNTTKNVKRVTMVLSRGAILCVINPPPFSRLPSFLIGERLNSLLFLSLLSSARFDFMTLSAFGFTASSSFGRSFLGGAFKAVSVRSTLFQPCSACRAPV